MTNQDKQDTFRVLPLTSAQDLEEKRRGRPAIAKFPGPPQELLDAMTQYEYDTYMYYVEALRERVGKKVGKLDEICIHNAAFEHINYLRVQVTQLKAGEVISQARQHPGVQERAWLDILKVMPKERGKEEKGEDLVQKGLRALSS